MLATGVLTGLSHVHSAASRKHVAAWSRPVRASVPDHVELGDTRIPLSRVSRRVVQAPTRMTRLEHPRVESSGVIVGYVGSDAGSNAFHRLARMTQGDRVKVVHHDGRIVWFKVDSVRRMTGPLDSGGRTMRASGRADELRLVSPEAVRSPALEGDPGNIVVSAHLDPDR